MRPRLGILAREAQKWILAWDAEIGNQSFMIIMYDMEIFCKNIKLGEFVGKVCFLRNHLSLRQIIKVSAQPLTSRMYKNMGREIFFYQ